jgi:hypothetical protein
MIVFCHLLLVTSASLSANVVKMFSVSANGKKKSFRIYANGANILRLGLTELL